MSLWLDGGFWGRWIRNVYVSEIEWMKRSVFDHILPSFPDPDAEADKARDAAWEAAISQPSDYSDDLSSYVDWATEKGLETYEGFAKMRQAAVNLSATMLWHLLEQQMLVFHMRQVLSKDEEVEARQDPGIRRRLSNLDEFHKRLEADGCSMRALPSWPKVDELRLVANAVKHGPGKSLDDLYKIRPDLLTLPESKTLDLPLQQHLAWVEKPAGGEDIYVRDADLAIYFDAAISLWQEFSNAIEEHSARRR
jgi:hypothetical protein